MLQLLVGTNIPFMKFRRIAYVFSGVLLAATIVWFVAKGPRYSVDFTGGTLLQVRLNHPVAADQLRHALSGQHLEAEIQQATGGGQNEYIVRFRTAGDPVAQFEQALHQAVPGTEIAE